MVNGNDETSHAKVGNWRYIRHSELLSDLVPVAMVLLKSGVGVPEDEGSVLQFHHNAMINGGTFSLGPKSRQGEILSHQWV